MSDVCDTCQIVITTPGPTVAEVVVTQPGPPVAFIHIFDPSIGAASLPPGFRILFDGLLTKAILTQNNNPVAEWPLHEYRP